MIKKVLGIIPARGGSKRLPGKNIRLLAGKPLISYTIFAALKSHVFDLLVVTTDDEAIARISADEGVEVIKRPDFLARDTSSTVEVVFHVLDMLKIKNYIPDIIIILQPTSPLRESDDIINALIKFQHSTCDSVVAVSPANKSPLWNYTIQDEYLIPFIKKQNPFQKNLDLQTVFIPNGSLYITTPSNLRKKRTLYTKKTIPYIMPCQRGVDIDTEMDFILAESLILRGISSNGK
jgi:CMP-N-acetylneuraminic acid synthetase